MIESEFSFMNKLIQRMVDMKKTKILCNAIICLRICYNDVTPTIITGRESVHQQHYVDEISPVTLKNGRKLMKHQLILIITREHNAKISFQMFGRTHDGFSTASIETLVTIRNVTYHVGIKDRIRLSVRKIQSSALNRTTDC